MIVISMLWLGILFLILAWHGANAFIGGLLLTLSVYVLWHKQGRNRIKRVMAQAEQDAVIASEHMAILKDVLAKNKRGAISVLENVDIKESLIEHGLITESEAEQLTHKTAWQQLAALNYRREQRVDMIRQKTQEALHHIRWSAAMAGLAVLICPATICILGPFFIAFWAYEK